jgi:TPR repeat protein
MNASLIHSPYWETIRKLFAQAEVIQEPAAQRKLGEIYAYGLDGGDGEDFVRPNPQEAIRWLSTSAAQGDAEANFHLGACFDPGRLNFVNEADVALGCYRTAIRLGYHDARLAIAELHLANRGTGMSPQQGRRILAQEAYRGSLVAQRRVAELLEADGRTQVARAWRLVAGEKTRSASKAVDELVRMIRQFIWFHHLVEIGDAHTHANLRNWLKASIAI